MSSRHLPTPPHAGSYGVIYADPPWNFKTWSDKGKGRSAEAHFDCMELGEIKALPVRSWAAKKAVLYLWTTVPHLAQALAVMPAWGFTYKSNFVWAKRVRGFGTGYWCRNSARAALDRRQRGSKVCPRYRGIEAAGFGDRRAAAGVCAQARSRPRDHRAVSPRRAQTGDVPA